ncbi:acylneuraminate cytidylyltransferase [Planctomycetales bacterium]|nr:acylneuraminate cytidylyltransferase [Planctomycetales bacterium]GHT06278.1 acylneuraminate cytidylyltransferase [Planctomycetales bacterium]GHV23680.1 acylneuraminate cytidylyltransferase [Planctomycetales bacterium]
MKLILTDVDGVLTDGCVTLDVQGNETKKICYRDLDAIGIGRRAGYEFGFITGEDTPMARSLAKRFGIEIAYFGIKNKLATMAEITARTGVDVKNVVYIGDADSDIALLAAAGLGIAPADATFNARKTALITAESKGGTGVLLEIVDKLIAGALVFPR